MKDLDAAKAGWATMLPSGQPDKVALARIVDADGGRDDAENSYYECAADPDYVRNETVQRRFRGQYFRRIKRLQDRARQGSQRDEA